jgi:hypothetical protein
VRTTISYVLKGRLVGQSPIRSTHDSLRASLSSYLGLGPSFSSRWLNLAIALFILWLILTRLTTYAYHVDRQLNRARYLSRARITSKINHVTNRQELRDSYRAFSRGSEVQSSFYGRELLS